MGASSPTLLLIFLLVAVALTSINADIYGNLSPPPPPPSGPPPPYDVAGKSFPPDETTCRNPFQRCFGRRITCPKQCPATKPAEVKAKACFVDCDSPKCEATCKNRKPSCNLPGSACYDPRFVGGDGVLFYFHGKRNEHFSLVSDTNLQVNARFIGRRPLGRTRDSTWIQALGLMYNSESLSFGAVKTTKWEDDVDHFFFNFNNEPFHIPAQHLATWHSPDGKLSVERVVKTNSLTITLAGVTEMTVNVVPVTKEDDKIHNYQIPKDDCFAHLEVQFKFYNLSKKVEGVLGQTYRSEFKNPVKRGVPMPVMGGEDKFKVSTLLSSDCKYCIFSPMSTPTDDILEPMAFDCASKIGSGSGIVCRR